MSKPTDQTIGGRKRRPSGRPSMFEDSRPDLPGRPNCEPLSDAQAVVQALKEKGLRVTPQRCAVYANLLARNDHPTVEQILTDLNQELPVSSKATVYSSLQALREVGLVREVLLEGGVSRYDANVDRHHHFQCRQCGAIEDVPWEAFQEASLELLRPGLQPDSYEVTVWGTCDRCASEDND